MNKVASFICRGSVNRKNLEKKETGQSMISRLQYC